MECTHGLLPGQVLQRNADNRAAANICGVCDGEGMLEARIRANGKTAPGQDRRTVGTAADGAFDGLLDDLRPGGPYTVELRVRAGKKTVDSMEIPDIFVGDVWFLAGQSNMQGVGNMCDAPKPHPQIRAFYMRDEWALAEEPLHFMPEAVDAVHNGGSPLDPEEAKIRRAQEMKGVCPGLWFAREMRKRTRVPQGLVCCAHGGTSMDQWSPEKKDLGGGSLYGAMLRRFRTLGQPVAGILWYQGESDAHPAAAEVYADKMDRLVAATREDFEQPDLPWVAVQIGRVVSAGWNRIAWSRIREEERKLPDRIRNLEVASAVDLELDDCIHISAVGHGVLGERLARMADRIVLGNTKERGSLRIRSVDISAGSPHPGQNWTEVEIRVRNAAGGLRSAGLPSGFSVLDRELNEVPVLYKTRVAGSSIFLEIASASMPFETGDLRIAYGYGLDPYCNITDGRGMALPAFGPVTVRGSGATDFISGWKTSKRLPLSGCVTEAPLPDGGASALGWKTPRLIDDAWSLVMPQDPKRGKDGMFYLRASVTSDAARTVLLGFGADGPFRLWLDGEEVLKDAKATNPCMVDEYRAPVELAEGENEIVVAFDGRGGAGWGVCARFLPAEGDDAIPESAITV